MENIDSKLLEAEAALRSEFEAVDAVCHRNTARVLNAFLNNGLSEEHFASVTGYGHNDTGRETTDAIFAEVFQAEAALVRAQFVSGTHAIAVALRGALGARGGSLVSITGEPYDTLEEVIGTRGDSAMSLMAQGTSYHCLNLLTETGIRTELTAEERHVLENATVVFIQRSRGYSLRPSLGIEDIGRLIACVKTGPPTVKVVVDNCYGEFIEDREPTVVGADLIAGSLIKNPGGGIVPTGGYIAGKAASVKAAADALTAPGIGTKGGYTFELTRTILQGFYLAPTVVASALKGMRLFAHVFDALGYRVAPTPQQPQRDIIQVIELGEPEKVLAFCKALQSVSPVDARLTPIPAITPGYADPVVMAGGTFIFGSTIELSADAPMRAPYAVFLQGGLTYSHCRYALQKIVSQVHKTHAVEAPRPIGLV